MNSGSDSAGSLDQLFEPSDAVNLVDHIVPCFEGEWVNCLTSFYSQLPRLRRGVRALGIKLELS